MGLTRTSSGLLIRDEFASDTTASYTAGGDAGKSYAVAGGVLTQSIAAKWGDFRRNTLTTCLCATTRTRTAGAGNWRGLECAMGATPDGDGYFPHYELIGHASAGLLLRERSANAWNTLASDATNLAVDTYHLMRVYTTGVQVTGRVGTTTLGTAVLTAADATLTDGSGGLECYGAVDWDWVDLRTSHLITCTGMTTGHYLRVSDGTTAAEAQESSGTATVDAGTVIFPLVSVQIRTAAEGGGSLIAEITSAVLADMGGGDVFEYATRKAFQHITPRYRLLRRAG